MGGYYDASSGGGMWVYGMNQAGSRWGQVVGSCEFDNEYTGSIKCGKFLDQFRKRNVLYGVSKSSVSLCFTINRRCVGYKTMTDV
jgi:hypothetical protein